MPTTESKLLDEPGKDDVTTAQSIVREWAEHDMNEHYNSDYLRDEFGSEHLEQRIVAVLASVRKEAREAAFKEAIKIAKAEAYERRMAYCVVDALEALANSEKGEMNG